MSARAQLVPCGSPRRAVSARPGPLRFPRSPSGSSSQAILLRYHWREPKWRESCRTTRTRSPPGSWRPGNGSSGCWVTWTGRAPRVRARSTGRALEERWKSSWPGGAGRLPPRPRPSWRPGCPKERSVTVSGWPKSARVTYLTPARHTADVLATGEPRTAAARTANTRLTAGLVDNTPRALAAAFHGRGRTRSGFRVYQAAGWEIWFTLRSGSKLCW